MFNVEVHRDKIELTPVEIRKKEFSPAMYKKLRILSAQEKGKEQKVTKTLIKTLKTGK